MTDQPTTPAPEATPAPTAEPPAATPPANEPAPNAPTGDQPPANTPPEGDKTPETPEAPESLLDAAKKTDEPDPKEKAEEGDQDPEEKKKDEGDEEKEGDEGDEPTVTFDIKDLEVPEDMPIPEDIAEEVTKLAETHKLDKDAVQELTNVHIKMQRRQLENWANLQKDWNKESTDYITSQGDDPKAYAGRVNDVVAKFALNTEFGGSEELFEEVQEDLKLLGLGNKKSFLIMMHNIAKATQGDSAAGGAASGSAPTLSRAEILYGQEKK